MGSENIIFMFVVCLYSRQVIKFAFYEYIRQHLKKSLFFFVFFPKYVFLVLFRDHPAYSGENRLKIGRKMTEI